MSYFVVYHSKNTCFSSKYNFHQSALKYYNSIPKKYAKIIFKENSIIKTYGNNKWINKILKYVNSNLTSLFIFINILDVYFDRIFIINLDKRVDRWNKIILQLEQLKINNYERFSAIIPDIDNINKKYFNNFTYPKSHKVTKQYYIGAIGCKLSHYNIVKLCKQRNYKNVLILEDDVILNSNIDNRFRKIIQNNKDIDWDMLYLGGNYIKGNKINSSLFKIKKCLTTHAYAIKNILYDFILNNCLQSGTEIDVFYTNIQSKFNCYGIQKPLAHQADDFSDIQGRVVKYNLNKVIK